MYIHSGRNIIDGERLQYPGQNIFLPIVLTSVIDW